MGLFNLFKTKEFYGATRFGLMCSYQEAATKEGLSEEIINNCKELYELEKEEYKNKAAEIERASEPGTEKREQLEDWLDRSYNIDAIPTLKDYISEVFGRYANKEYHANWRQKFSEEGEKWYNHVQKNKDNISFVSPTAQKLIDLYLAEKEFYQISEDNHQAIVCFIENIKKKKPQIQKQYFPTYMEYKAGFRAYISESLETERFKAQSYKKAIEAVKKEQEVSQEKKEVMPHREISPHTDEHLSKPSCVKIVFQDPEL